MLARRHLLLLAVSAALAASMGVGCTQDGCPAPFLWSAELPADVSYERVRALTVRACRNGDCVEGLLDFLPAAEWRVGAGIGSMLERPSEPDRGSGAWVTVRQETSGAFGVEVSWYESDARDGDRYLVEVSGSEGVVIGLAEQTVAYRTWHPNGPVACCECRQVILEGSTLSAAP